MLDTSTVGIVFLLFSARSNYFNERERVGHLFEMLIESMELMLEIQKLRYSCGGAYNKKTHHESCYTYRRPATCACLAKGR